MTPLFWIDRRFPGRLAVVARPRGGDWLEDEFRSWHRQGVDIVVSLLTSEEYEELDLGDESGRVAGQGMEFVPFPVPDRSVPGSSTNFVALAQRLGQTLLAGRSVAIHCRQGVGRSALLAAAVLTSLGLPVESAWTLIGQARGLPVPETAEQRAWLERHARSIAPPPQPA